MRALISFAFMTSLCANAQTITEYRWWINDDFSTLITTSGGPDAVLNLATTLDLPALEKDVNHITIQFKDSDGRYSVPFTKVFTRATGEVTGYEYWIDDDIASVQSGSIGPAMVVDLIADLPTGLNAGEHLFTIRFSGASGTWSVPHSSTFSVITSIEELPEITELVIFPNPVDQQLGIRIEAAKTQSLDLEILDLSGRSVQELGVWNVSGVDRRYWEIGTLAQGQYILRLSDGSGQRNISFTKH